MNFDEILEFLFHKPIGKIIAIASGVMLMLALSSCLPLDFCGCFWHGCGCTDCGDSCISSSEDCDDTCFTCFGGDYSYDYENNGYGEYSCALNECLFGRYGCERECGDCYVDCGGVNYTMCTDCYTCGCSTTEDGYDRVSCLNCMTYCDGTSDPDSPNYQEIFLYSITVKGLDGGSSTVHIYESTRHISAPGISGMSFKGYFSGPNAQGTQYTDEYGDILVFPPSGAVLYPHYTDMFAGEKFTMNIYIAQEGTNGNYTETRNELYDFDIESGALLSSYLPAEDYKEGYEFIGWAYYNNYTGNYEYVYKDGEIVTQYETFRPGLWGIGEYSSVRNIHLYAVYGKIRHTITVIFPEEFGLSNSIFTPLDGQTLRESGATFSDRNGYKYAGLSTDGTTEGILSEDYVPEEDMTLYAMYKEPMKLWFDETGVGGTKYSIDYYDGQLVELPEPKVAPTGQEYANWYLSDNFVRYTSLTMSAEFKDKTLMPEYKYAEYTIFLLDADGETPLYELPYTINDEKTLPTPTNDYYIFDGWYTSKTGGIKVTSVAEGSTGDKTFYIRYTPKEYTIELDPTGGSLSNISKDVKYGAAFTLPVPVRTGFHFTGWYYSTGTGEKQLTGADGKSLANFTKFDGVYYPTPDSIDLSVYAKWEAKKYTVTFKAEGAPDSTATVQHNSYATEPSDPVLAGHDFVGWYKGSTLFEFTTPITGDTTLTAKFEPKTYTIKLVIAETDGYFEDSGMREITVEYTYNSNTVTIGDTPIRAGWTFSGWYRGGSNGAACINANGQKYSALLSYLTTPGTSEYTLYAKWVKDL